MPLSLFAYPAKLRTAVEILVLSAGHDLFVIRKANSLTLILKPIEEQNRIIQKLQWVLLPLGIFISALKPASRLDHLAAGDKRD